MKAGFHTSDITPPVGMEVPGDYVKAYSQSIHDPLKVRACVLDDGVQTAAIASIDTCILPHSNKLVTAVRRGVEERCGIPESHILVAATHTHSGGPLSGFLEEDVADAPELIRRLALEESPACDPLYLEIVTRQAVTAICEAHRKREEALLAVGKGFEEQVVFNRRFRMANGRVYTHPGKGSPDIVEPAGPVDPEVGVVAAWNRQGELLGCIVNYSCHATTFSGAISADYIYYLEEAIQHVMGRQSVVVFLNGACGDVTQVDNRSMRAPEFGERWSRLVGTRVGAEALKVMVSAQPGELKPVAVNSLTLRISRRRPNPNRVEASRELVEQGVKSSRRDTAWIFAKELLIADYLASKEPEVDVEMQAVQVGPVVFIAYPAEMFCELGLRVKKSSPFPYTFVVELANGSLGYVPPAEAFAPSGGGYETALTSYSNLDIHAGEKMVQASVDLLRSFTPGLVPQPPQLDHPQNPWSYGVLGPDLE